MMDINQMRRPKKLALWKVLLIVIIEGELEGESLTVRMDLAARGFETPARKATPREADWTRQTWRSRRSRLRQNVVGLRYYMRPGTWRAPTA